MERKTLAHAAYIYLCAFLHQNRQTDSLVYSQVLLRSRVREIDGVMVLKPSSRILDLTDHVWTECFSDHLGSWKKHLNYVIAIAKDGVYDVTKRYTRKWHEVLARRTITTESKLSSFLENLTKQCRRDFRPELISMLEERDRNEIEAFERNLHSKDDGAVSLPGRLSGDKQWRISRSEYGAGEDSTLSSSSCPVRICVDEHVTNIYNAMVVVLSQFVGTSLSVDGVIDVLKVFQKILMDLKEAPFRFRRTSIKSSDNPQPSLYDLMPAFDELLHAFHLRRELDESGEMAVQLAGDPVRAALALPVALDAVDDVVRSLDKCASIGEDSLCLPLVRLNRIHSGSVLASGEELPFGIATAAFDGTRLSKWEEPNGAKGGWIAYKLKDGQVCELEAYELMSANDAPERDPMDWILEGSSDEGSSWYVLDKQTSQKFEDRFQRKSYKIKSCGRQLNAFRFRFLAVRDAGSTSRLQIGVEAEACGLCQD
ncbi:hypothetical protein Cgig2_000067 [Carnegiea gigantea]|uniref:Rad4/PNGase transglutaminase-like fold domain-containing protein n=1 Tax=Carnegiea gigantea TaxID=171969 RepID=A0A9Q1L0Y0_9CARY|nr:hypothetical protein Cgig2_000067 [Carnegiea gigantea]